ncbi:MAG TPA: SpoIIE family protein phosphatase [Solirubrobacteraceae bacterium]|nr:SpoIIE family protein phosphatase [Solirubrobacteraceae bacterium]
MSSVETHRQPREPGEWTGARPAAASGADAGGTPRARAESRDWAVALLVETGAVLSSSLDLATTMDRVARLTIPALADLCVIDLLDDSGTIAEIAAASADPALAHGLEAMRARFPLDPGGPHPVARVIRSGEAELRAEMHADLLRSFAQGSEHARFMIENGYRSAVVAPLTARGRTLGALSALRLTGSEPYTADDLALACEIARRAALAIDNAQLYADLRAVEGRLEAVLENLAEAITVIDAQGRTVFANQAAVDLLGLGSAEDLAEAKPGEIMARFRVLDEAGRELGLSDMPARRIFNGEDAPPLLVRNIVRATGEERWVVVRASAIRDPATGAIAFVANVLENVTDVKRAQLAEAFMARTSRVLASSMDYGTTLKTVAREAATYLADWCAVDLVGERGAIERVAVHHNDPEKLALAERIDRLHRPSPSAQTGVPDVIRTGKAVLFNDIAPEDLARYARNDEHLRLLTELGARDVIIVPLAAPTHALGAITLVSSHEGRRLTEGDLDVAIRLGRRSGTAVESARLYTERTRIARTLQRALLPSLPDVPGLSIAASYRPAGELNEVGGDFYDVVGCGGERWMLVIGDVCGKGAEAAAVTALARYTLRAVAMFDPQPVKMLHALHEALRQQGFGEQMCTACVATIEPFGNRARLTLALAGHPQPLLVGPGDSVHPVGEPGTVLGIVDPVTVREIEFELRTGQTLVMYTDGVTDAARPDALETAGLERLAARVGGLPLPEMLAHIERSAVERASGEPHDDIALLAVRIAAPDDLT